MSRRTPFLMTAVAIAMTTMLTACMTPMKRSTAADTVRAELTALQSTPELANRAPVAIRDAELAVQSAELPQRDKQLSQHLVLIADRKVKIARALAQTNLLEERRRQLAEQRDTVRLDARTREADKAHAQADAALDAAERARDATDRARSETLIARTEAERQESLAEAATRATHQAQQQTEIARTEAARQESVAEAANRATNQAQQQTEIARTEAERQQSLTAAAVVASEQAQQQTDRMRREVAELNAKQTDRGLVVTLGDVLFASGQSTINGNSAGNLDKVAGFLTRYPDRRVAVEGHTDSTGTEAANLLLSSRRADAVQRYLVEHGVKTTRITATGRGESTPVSDNATSAGRQQNRRVELIIANELASQ